MSLNNESTYRKSYIKGKGEIIDAWGVQRSFLVDDISAVGADITYDGEVTFEDVYSVKVRFDMPFGEKVLDLKARFNQNENEQNSYYIKFEELCDIKRVEIDEIIKHLDEDLSSAFEGGDWSLMHHRNNK